MTAKAANEISVGKYSGIVEARYQDAGLLSQLSSIRGLLEGKDADILSSGRNQNIKVALSFNGSRLEIAVKAFGRQSAFKEWIDARRGSKARRTWAAASYLAGKGIGTPPPLGFLEYRHDGRLLESYYLSEYQQDVTSFKDELVRMLRHDSRCEKIMALMQYVAESVRAMHDAGFLHNDLGNQNILLRRKDDASWGGIQFIDLNRGRIAGQLSLRERARDISRIYLPSDLMRVFKEMYFAPVVPPAEFLRQETWYRQLYAIHSGTRWLRHPVRTRNLRRVEHGRTDYPSQKDMWIWDECSGQAISAMKPSDRSRYYGLERHLMVLWRTLIRFLPVLKTYFSILPSCYRNPVQLSGRIGMSINPVPETVDRELALLKDLGIIPVFVRFYAHESEKEWGFLAHIVKALHGEGHQVSIALVQNRNCVLDSRAWALFVSYVLGRVNGFVDSVEICHAINRVKWGIWDFEEHCRLIDAVAAIADMYPDVKFMGPAVIDFEYPFVLAALGDIPEKLHLSALSHHLYVDRRGAPENRQGFFSALEKFALARAIARCSPQCDDSLVVSEVNWPLKGTGVYSPVNSPYESPGPRFNDPGVSEDEYADYMLRYIVMAVCSGIVDRVFWWRLVARGYGLVDDTDSAHWRKRPAYLAMKYFLETLGESRFMDKLPADREGVHLFVFVRPDGSRVCFAYSSAGEVNFKLPFEYSHLVGVIGEKLTGDSGAINFSGRPLYAFLK